MITSLKVVLFIGIFVLVSPAFGQGEKPPHFGGEITILSLSENRLMNSPDLSTGGEFVFSHVSSYGRRLVPLQPFLGASQYVWDLRDAGTEGRIRSLQPTWQLHVDETELGHGWAFSPTGQYLALGSPTNLQILTLPDMEQYSTVPIIPNVGYPSSNSLSWSMDGEYLAVLEDQDIVVWGVAEDQVTQHALGWQYANVIPTRTGWYGIYGTSFGEGEGGFFVCTTKLESCRDYRFPTLVTALISNAGDVMLTQMGAHFSDEGASVQLWRHQSGSEYQPRDEEFSTREIGCPRRFSPDDRYLTMACELNLWSVHSFPSFEPVLHLSDNERPAWLPDSKHLVALDPFELTLHLYSLSSEQPIDTINLVERVGNWIGNSINHEATTRQYPNISDDGSRVSITVGWTTFVIPIEFE